MWKDDQKSGSESFGNMPLLDRMLVQGKMPSDEPYQGAKAAVANAMTWADLYGDDACSWLEARMAERSG